MAKKALFAGTFDPPTWGHLSVIKRAVPLFDRLIIGVAKDERKEHALLSVEERIHLLKDLTKLDVVEVNGLLAEFVKKNGINVLVRSIRSGTDVENELTMAEANRQLCGVETLFLMCEPQHTFINSTLVREIAHLGGNLDPFVPPAVAHTLKVHA